MKWNACSIVRSGQAAFNRARAAMASEQAGVSPVTIDGCQICTNAVLGQDGQDGRDSRDFPIPRCPHSYDHEVRHTDS
jgi:hypothetical protein